MKKTVLLFTVLLQVAISFGQTNWGSWNQPNCYKGIQFRCKVKDYNNAAKQYTWDVEIKNNYNSKVSLNYDIQNSSIDGRTTINAGGTDKSWTLNSSNTTLYITFSKVCFHHPNGFDQCSEYNQKGYASYAECDNGSPKYQIYNGKTINSSTQNSTTNPQTNSTQKNSDPTFDRNNASFQDYYKRAMAAKDAGNYEEAKSYLNSAISMAVNDAQKDNAKQWLTVVENAPSNNNKPTNTIRNPPSSSSNGDRYETTTPQKTQQQIQAYNLQVLQNQVSTMQLQQLQESYAKSPVKKLELDDVEIKHKNRNNNTGIATADAASIVANANANSSFNFAQLEMERDKEAKFSDGNFVKWLLTNTQIPLDSTGHLQKAEIFVSFSLSANVNIESISVKTDNNAFIKPVTNAILASEKRWQAAIKNRFPTSQKIVYNFKIE